MPELPEVETVRRGLQPFMEGSTILTVEQRRPDLRFPFPKHFIERLTGRRIEALERRAKYLIIHLDDGLGLISHLGMSGSYRIEQDQESDTPGVFEHERSQNTTHDHVVMHLGGRDQPKRRIIYNDPRRFGFMLFAEPGKLNLHPLIKDLGTEPTGNRLDGALLARLFHNKAAPLKAALLDQKLIAGLGNIYVCEAMWRAGLSPLRPAGSIAGENGVAAEMSERLATSIRSVIADAIKAGGSSLKDYRQADGELGYFQHSFSVYDREGSPCPRAGCGGTVSRIVQSGRSTFYCPVCQQ
ncbi:MULTISPECIES: bifunctional DNA-formamidopyrimidine glycosylase/DNA-(apurinic or apyrimidinic site) lyase [Phyllobacterium]|jgi:formamidopyrimidine-DNA glycosylase|uniref:Formamidopyrimidine-DNA glycosylase n=1 Tax=Phyllobacterium sophorae TaxID=1520277 RepID=A0A2P7BCK3_9HYPH|nr:MULTISPECIES: bifunctional DNA-formamidopyrimidine glycosylase/DNA-(apurinic or apyrimidinic site) lyase [Phyllobacterium]PSH64183.1 DNA-formamidopyrimidine glycosylase [Phyllobacterium sophorae]UXN63015.1 bifunctional DNA-formamidopyrimidine glycosylase/DNA-(apurinic or apyrimidinic site) lyase [Phyllobacterium sp. A18/5-2]